MSDSHTCVSRSLLIARSCPIVHTSIHKLRIKLVRKEFHTFDTWDSCEPAFGLNETATV